MLYKSIFDKILALVLIVLFSPFYIIVSILILTKMGKPILFKQKRPGYTAIYLAYISLER